jgi:hypothetical protein
MPGAPGDADNEFFSTTFSSSDTVTAAIWFKFEDALPASERILELRNVAGDGDTSLRVQTKSSTRMRLIINNSPRVDYTDPASALRPDSDALLTADTWFHLAVTIDKASPEIKVYLNGSLVMTETTSTSAPSENLGRLYLGGTTANSNGFYSDCTLFDTVLDAPEVLALYNGVGSIDPRDHSEASNLVSWWAFEDNFYKNYFSTDDTGTLILDRVGSNNLSIDTNAATFGNGRFIDTAFANGQFFKLIGQQQVDISAKCIFMAVQCNGTSLEYSIFSSLTGIPAERMKGIGTYE